MIVDLHSHYPMHLLEGDPRSHQALAFQAPGSLPAWLRRPLMQIANQVANYPAGKPVADIPNYRAGGVKVVLSVLIDPFSEIDTTKRYAAPPDNRYFEALLRQVALVEDSIAKAADVAVIVRNRAELDDGLKGDRVVLIHAVEGGFHFGSDPVTIRANVAEAARRGIAYVTPAHLFWRQVATNAPALAGVMPDWMFRLCFNQPKQGLTEIGRALVSALVEHGVLVDVTHMSERSLVDTFALLDQLDPGRTLPVLATHTACRFGGLEFNLRDTDIEMIKARGGVVGLSACKHLTHDKTGVDPKNFDDSMEVIHRHIERIHRVTRSHDTVAIGADFDGFIKPTLPGFDDPAKFPELRKHLATWYAPDDVEKICSGNALRVLRHWKGAPQV